jgi:hypothetical protein
MYVIRDHALGIVIGLEDYNDSTRSHIAHEDMYLMHAHYYLSKRNI